MKTVLSLFVTGLLATSAFAQNFEGTITWAYRTEMDPAMQQQMDAAQAMMADPAILAQMQAAMADPQMKAMIEQNPQMKAMIEQQMGRGRAGAGARAGGNPMANMMPTGMTLKIKGMNALVVTEGGASPTEVLTLGDKQMAYSLDRANRSYQALPPTAPTAQAPTFKVTKTAETATIQTYKAQKYLVEQIATPAAGRAAMVPGRGRGPQAAEMMSISIWTTTDIKGVDAKQLARMDVGSGDQTNFMKELEGVPVKMEMSGPGMKITMEVASVKRETLSDDLFKLPAGFTERK